MAEILPFELPARLDNVDAEFMTELLRYSGVISAPNKVIRIEEADVGMTAGYFSAIKKVKCVYREPTGACSSFVVKTWPQFEMLPKDAIRAMFASDIKAYTDFDDDEFYPRPQSLLAACDEAKDCWVLVMEDADAFAEHKVHETELTLDEIRFMIPKLVDIAVYWEGCDQGSKAEKLAAIGVDFWVSKTNLGMYRDVMPGGARLFDKFVSLDSWDKPTWDAELGPDFAAEYTKRLDAFFAKAHPRNGATCTLSHGDLRGDNIFFAPKSPRCPHGWLVIDFQVLFRGPVPSDLAYLMNSGSVLPEVYSGDNLKAILREFHEAFMAKTRIYRHYSYDQVEQEYIMMATVLFLYYVGMGAAIWQEGAFRNAQPARVELGDQGVTEEDLAPEELRKRMWWKKTLRNFRETFKTYDQYQYIQSLPCDHTPPEFVELPDHLR